MRERCPCIALNHDHPRAKCERTRDSGYLTCRECHYYRASHVNQRTQR